MSREDWLSKVKVGDTVRVRIGQRLLEPQAVTSSSRTMITIGQFRAKKNFSRTDGNICGNPPLKWLFWIERPE